MSDKIIIIFAFLLLNSCNGQNDNKKNEIKSGKSVENAKIKKEITMEKFDIEKFNKHQQDNEWNYVDDEGNSVRERKDESIIFENNEYTTKTKMEGYIVETALKNNIFFPYKSFHTNSIIAVKGYSFQGRGFNKGIWKEYNEKGELTKETDYDIPYKNFPWEKVEEFLKSKNVDLMSPFTGVNREVDEKNNPVWYLEWDTGKKDKSMFQIIENVEIDANTGKIIKEYQTFREP